MKLTRASSYALHALVWMASQKSNAPAASHKIAADRHIPERFLLKVLKPLVSARILYSIKGPNGGYRLAKPANKITMLDVIEAVDGPIRADVPQWEGSDAFTEKQVTKWANETAEREKREWQRRTIDNLVGGAKK